MKTILQALIDEVHYPVSVGYLENKLLQRGLDGDSNCTAEIVNGKQFKGAVADCLYSLIEAPNFSEADKSFSLGDKKLILKKASLLYSQIGEGSKVLTEDSVEIIHI